MSLVSIIVPSYNHSQFLQERLDSIQQQTFKDWELIIIDDCSTDKSIEILKKFVNENKTRIKHFIINESNSGSGYNSWQKGIELAETEYIWIAETDDYSSHTFLEEMVAILEVNKKVALVFSSSNYVENGTIIYDSNKRTKNLQVKLNECKVIDKAIFLNRMPFDTYITNGSSVVFRKPKLKLPSELFDNSLCSDIFLWSYLVQNSSFAFLNKKLNFFRRHEGSISSYLQKNKLESVYHEKAKYLSYFGQVDKQNEFLDHYIKHYIWNHKQDFLNTSPIEIIESGYRIKMEYFYKLIRFVVSKILNK